MYETRTTVQDGTTYDGEYHLIVEDTKSFFQYQWKQYLSGAQSGYDTNLNFVGKSGEMVLGHQVVVLPFSSHLKFLVESSESCGCADDVPTFLLPDWDRKIIQAMFSLLYSGSVTVTGDEMKDLLSLIYELRFDISRDRLAVEPVVQLPDDIKNHSNSIQAADCTLEISSDDKLKVDWVRSIKIENVHTEIRNKEHEWAIKKLREVLEFLERLQIMTEESFDVISKPLDDLRSSLKYIPTVSSFDILPNEIKSDILSYLCDSESLVAASVCLDWKEVLTKRLVMLGEIKIGKHCSNAYSCEAIKCFKPEEMLKASITVNLDVRLKICHPVIDIDAKLIAESLANVSEFSITEECNCGSFTGDVDILTKNQTKVLIDTLEERKEKLKSIEINGLNMIHLDQERLVNYLLKVERLLLCDRTYFEPQLDGKMLIDILLHNISDLKVKEFYLESLSLRNPYWKFGMEFFPHYDLAEEFAYALCQVETIYLGRSFGIEDLTTKRLISNILTKCIKMENLFIFRNVNWDILISPQDLTIMLAKLKRFAFCGEFTSEQLKSVRSIAGITVDPIVGGNIIRKGIDIDTSLITHASFDFELTDIFFNK